MDIRFDDQVVLITGASTGIGAALAKAFSAAGAKVVVNYSASEGAAKLVANAIEAAGGEALVVKADVTDQAQVKDMVAQTLNRFSRVDVLINNAGGIVQRRAVAELPVEVYQNIMDLNMTSIFYVCQEVIPVMQRQGRGNIINITSIAARNGGGGNSVIYATSKGAVSTFTRGLAKELAGANIRVNAISPGIIQTPFHDRYSKPEQIESWLANVPMGRVGQPEEIVGPAFFLASDTLSSYVTGQVIEVNGGQLMP